KFLARRIHRIPALLILTYRDDEIDRDHPLRLVLGDLPARDVIRLQLPPLSEAVVLALAEQAGRPTERLYATTGESVLCHRGACQPCAGDSRDHPRRGDDTGR